MVEFSASRHGERLPGGRRSETGRGAGALGRRIKVRWRPLASDRTGR